MVFGLPQSIATLLTIIMIYAMDSVFISCTEKRKISQQLRAPCIFQIHPEV
jgi:hypothetical protein